MALYVGDMFKKVQGVLLVEMKLGKAVITPTTHQSLPKLQRTLNLLSIWAANHNFYCARMMRSELLRSIRVSGRSYKRSVAGAAFSDVVL